MTRQKEIDQKMRVILIDWLVDVHVKFRLIPETLHLCVSIIDRYCSIATEVPRSKLQLVGVASLLVACRHEEIYTPELGDLVYICDKAYDCQEILDMEQTILRVLSRKINVPTSYTFLDRFLVLTNASAMTRHAASYYLDMTLHVHFLLQYRPSLVCASTVILALNNPDICVLEEKCKHNELSGLVRVVLFYTLIFNNS